MEGKAPGIKYNGYSACPIITEYGKVLMCEFGYGTKDSSHDPLPRPRHRTRHVVNLEVHGLMPMYYGMLQGLI